MSESELFHSREWVFENLKRLEIQQDVHLWIILLYLSSPYSLFIELQEICLLKRGKSLFLTCWNIFSSFSPFVLLWHIPDLQYFGNYFLVYDR